MQIYSNSGKLSLPRHFDNSVPPTVLPREILGSHLGGQSSHVLLAAQFLTAWLLFQTSSSSHLWRIGSTCHFTIVFICSHRWSIAALRNVYSVVCLICNYDDLTKWINCLFYLCHIIDIYVHAQLAILQFCQYNYECFFVLFSVLLKSPETFGNKSESLLVMGFVLGRVFACYRNGRYHPSLLTQHMHCSRRPVQSSSVLNWSVVH